MLFAQSCIVADPPEYRAPGQTRPVLNVYGAVPTATQVLEVSTMPPKTATTLTVQVRSEDAGEPLRAVLFLDYQVMENLDPNNFQPGEKTLISLTIPASTYSNTGRVFEYPWLPSTTSGCHFLSLIVAHHNSFLQSSDEVHLNPRFANDDAAIVTWTVNVNPPDDGSLPNCPTNTLPTVP